MTHDELMIALLCERQSGMPRWRLRPAPTQQVNRDQQHWKRPFTQAEMDRFEAMEERAKEWDWAPDLPANVRPLRKAS